MAVADYRSAFDLSGQVAIVTGAGRGIGYAIAEALGAFGCRVAVAELDPASCAAAADRLTEQGVDALPVPTDITDSEQLRALFDRVQQTWGRLDVLVNNAGVSARIAAEDYPDDNYHRMVALNQTAVFFAMREAATRWIARGQGGRIINLASFAGVVADPMSVPYAMTKGAVVQLTRTAAVEWASHGILVNAIGPGYIRTEMTAHTLDSPEAGAVIRAKTALGRPGAPADIAHAAVYLASRASSYATGAILMVDGGWTAM
jgi:gluconate 5-dehydrogenase